jgi:hypothetical protein
MIGASTFKPSLKQLIPVIQNIFGSTHEGYGSKTKY